MGTTPELSSASRAANVLIRILVRARRTAINLWSGSSGEWKWLAEKSIPLAALNRQLWRDSVPSLNFFVLLILSGIIATLGLLIDSTATVVGAMIVAPLMRPMVGMSYAAVVGNQRLLKRASLTLVKGVVVTVVAAVVTCQLAGLRVAGPEIVARANPTLIDLFVALAAGAAGAFAKSRVGVADAIPGVAIAVALVPPLCSVGIGLALLDTKVALGASLLFLANFGGIILSGALIFLSLEYGSFAKAQRGLVFSSSLILFLGVPLGLSFRQRLAHSNVSVEVSELLEASRNRLSQFEVSVVSARRQDEKINIVLEVRAPSAAISEMDVATVRDYLSRELRAPIALRVEIVPIRTIEIPAAD